MNKGVYYKYNGSNNATYIFNLSSLENILSSLEFYKPLGFKRKVLKRIFTFYLIILHILSKFIKIDQLYTLKSINHFLESIEQGVVFNIDTDSSIFISSTRDKVIVNHKNQYFEKFSFKKSISKTRHEIKMYSILKKKKYEYFQISEIKDVKEDRSICSFKLYNDFKELKTRTVDDNLLVNALVELFKVNETKLVKLKDLYVELKKDKYIETHLIEVMKTIENIYRIEKEVVLGFVHWDFKIWNIQPYKNKILIYDFEESKLDGLPMEDFYNYYIDAKIMSNVDIEDIELFIKSTDFKNLINNYIKKLKISTNINLLLILYLLNRIVFYNKNGSVIIVERYVQLLYKILEDQ